MQTKQNKSLLRFFPYVLFSQINILPIAGKQPSGTDIWKQIYMLPTNHFNKMLFLLAPCEMWPPVHGVWCPQDWCCHARLTVPLLLKKPPSAKTNNGLEFGECFWAKIMRCGWLPSSSTEQVQLAYSRGREKGWLKTKTRFICKRAGKTSLKGAWWDVRIPTSARKSAALLGFMNCDGVSEVFCMTLILCKLMGTTVVMLNFSSSCARTQGGSLALPDHLTIASLIITYLFLILL